MTRLDREKERKKVEMNMSSRICRQTYIPILTFTHGKNKIYKDKYSSRANVDKRTKRWWSSA